MAPHKKARSTLRTVDQILEAFDAELVRIQRPPNTVDAYVRDARHFARAFTVDGAAHFPATVQPVDVREYLAALRHAGAAPATIQRRRAALVVFFRWALAQGLCFASPMVDIIVPKPNPPTRIALRSRELRRLLRAVHRHGSIRDIAICELLAATGLRVAELVELELDDLELGQRRGFVRVRGKGYRERSVPLHADIRRTLRAWLEVRPSVLSPLLFPGRHGHALNRTTIERLLGKYARLAGDLPAITPHVLRHTLSTTLIREHREDPFVVQRLLGHASVATTQLYTAPDQIDLENAVNRLAAVEALR